MIAMRSSTREIAERALERLGRALELAADRFGQRLRRRLPARVVSTEPSDAPGARPNEIVTAGSWP